MNIKINYIIDDDQSVYEFVYSAAKYKYSSIFYNEYGPGEIQDGYWSDDNFLITDIFAI